MGTCAICFKPAPAGYSQCRDCIATFGVRENPMEFRKERLKNEGRAEGEAPVKTTLQEELEKLERAGDVQGLLALRNRQQDEELETAMKGARKNLLRRSLRSRTRVVRPRLRAPKFVWVLLAVYLGCAAAEHLSMASVYFLDFRARVIKNRAP